MRDHMRLPNDGHTQLRRDCIPDRCNLHAVHSGDRIGDRPDSDHVHDDEGR